MQKSACYSQVKLKLLCIVKCALFDDSYCSPICLLDTCALPRLQLLAAPYRERFIVASALSWNRVALPSVLSCMVLLLFIVR